MSEQREGKSIREHHLGPLLAAEIHDGFVQGVVGSHMILQGLLADEAALDEQTRSLLAEATSHLAVSIAEARRLIEQLSPLEITGNLSEQIAEWVCQESQIQSAHELVTDGDWEGLDPRIAGTIFRIAQEAVRNADIHGKANKVQLRLQRDAGGVCLTVSDDGAPLNTSNADHPNIAGVVQRTDLHLKRAARVNGWRWYVRGDCLK